MSAAKAKSKKNSGRWLAALLRLVLRRSVLVPVLVIAGLGGGAYAVWKYVEPHVISSPDYQIDLGQVVITPPPAWISRSDVKAEVAKMARLEGPISLMEKGLSERISKAFRLHAWVADVKSVRVQTNEITVDLVYRKPVCMVEVPGGFFAVDEEAFLLPSEDFTGNMVRRYPRLSGAQLLTPGSVGTRWQDARVQGAAKIAAAVLDVWDELYLNRIVPSVEQGQPLPGDSNEFDIITVGLTRIRWGRAPGAPPAGEATPQEKITALRDYAKDNQGLDGSTGPQDLDVRMGKVIATPRVASEPVPDAIPPK